MMNAKSKTLLLTFIWTCLFSANVRATGNIDTTNKNAWAENVGWANAAPVNGGVTVHFNGTSGYLTGYAWGENIGWIKLGDSSGGPYNNISDTDWGVNLNSASNLTGYAWGENVGWIKFDPAYSAVKIDMTTGRLSGNAWGENIGWIRFKGTSPDYNVRTLAFEKQPQGTPNWWLEGYGLTNYNTDVVADQDRDGMTAWQEYIAGTVPTESSSVLAITCTILSNGQKLLSWFGVQGRNYTFLYSDSLSSENWQSYPFEVPGSGSSILFLDTADLLHRFYRVTVKVSP